VENITIDNASISNLAKKMQPDAEACISGLPGPGFGESWMPWSLVRSMATALDDVRSITVDCAMITGAQMKAARALLGIDQKELARLSGVSLPTIQRMESSPGSVRAVVDSLEKVTNAINLAGVELIGSGARSEGSGRGVRLFERKQP
jgi:hypothetical protein